MENVCVYQYSFEECYVTVVFITRFYDLGFTIKRRIYIDSLRYSPPFPETKILRASQNMSILIIFPTQFLCYIVASVKDLYILGYCAAKIFKMSRNVAIRQHNIEEGSNL
jgi:hypothetical protein